MKGPHTSCWQGKRVRVVLRDGTVLKDQLVEARSKAIVLVEAGRIPKKTLKSFAILKEGCHG